MMSTLRLFPTLLLLALGSGASATGSQDAPAGEFLSRIRPLISKYCFGCHSVTKIKGGLDLERFATLGDVRADIEPWEAVLGMIERGEMPPEGKPRPKTDDLRVLTGWLRAFFDREAEARAGDPGPVPVRRLNNAELTYTIRDLTGVDLDPARRFPADNAAGEGFLNATDALSLSPDLLAKYLDAAKDVAAHAVLLPDGVRFSPSKFREDRVNEVLREIRALHTRYASDLGEIPVGRYLSGPSKGLSPKYLRTLRQAMTVERPSVLLEGVRAKWKAKEAAGFAADIAALQGRLWRKRKARNEHALSDRFIPAPATVAERHAFRLKLPKAKPGDSMVFSLVARTVRGEAKVVLKNLRLEGGRGAAETFPDAVMAGTGVREMRVDGARGSERTFVVEASLDSDGIVLFDVQREARLPGVTPGLSWQERDGAEKPPMLVGRADDETRKKVAESADAFRRLFPARICYPGVIVRDTTVTLERFHRADEPLSRLFLNAEDRKRLDRLWAELHFISGDALQVRDSLATLLQGEMGGVKAVLPEVHRRASEAEKKRIAAEPGHLEFLIDFAGRAYRRPLEEPARKGLLGLYASLRKEEIPHDEAFRAVLARVLMSAHFLYRPEKSPAGAEPGRVSDWELATRLSYFLWSSLPDAELRKAAADGTLGDPAELARQTRRMLKDARSRALAVEFGAQWVEVRGFDAFQGKNPERFPSFDAGLRRAMYEEAILFFQDFFRADRPVRELIDADHAFVNEPLAKHYGLPGVKGDGFRRVDGVREKGRGGMLVLGSVLSKHSGASRTSPVLRGVWISEILLGEKLPRPPDEVPELPEDESQGELSVRQLVEKHASAKACAVCHQRIDPLGFALEEYDTIGRRREKDLGGRPVDANARLRDGGRLEGIDGLKRYLLTDRKAEFDRQFCRKLLGYALGRRALLSDRNLLDEMVEALGKNDGRVSAAILTLVQSRQFRTIRGAEGVK